MPDDDNAQWGKYLGMGMQLCAGIGLGVLVGYYLDRKYGWSPWGILGGAMLGLASGMYLLIKEAMKMNKD